jgi:methionine-rich copper-binding protein CopC
MTDERIIAYFLHELPEEERERFEDECFAEEEWPEQIAAVEEDLIEAYLRDQLTPAQRRSFEQNYLVTEARQERVAAAAALLRYIDERNNERNAATEPRLDAVAPEQNWAERFRAFWGGTSWAARAAAAAAIVVLIAGALWYFLPRSTGTFATLTLTLSQSNRAEGAQVDKVKLASNTEALRVTLTLPQPTPQAARYRVELENADGEKRPVEVADQDAQAVRVVIPAAQLARGQYVLKLFAVGSDGGEQRINGSYFFAVE